MNNKYKFTKWWLAGFTQADGSFVIGFEKRNVGPLAPKARRKVATQGVSIGVYPRPAFVLTQSKRDQAMMEELQKWLGVGVIYNNRDCVSLVVRSLDDIINVILPIFDEHKLCSGKYQAYQVFKQVVLLMKDK